MSLRKDIALQNSSLEEKMIGSLINEEEAKETYQYQKDGLLKVIAAIEKKESLSVKLIKE
ncbi:MAG: hypothetical protein JO131_01965, partial [Gammaproteobacteria bacterium]|nr:hypothetical protein [Gammaproteobacteria bacterium]